MSDTGEFIKIIGQLKTRLAIANKQILDYEQTEAAVCPEDVGIERYVKSLQAQLATAKEEANELIKSIDKVNNEGVRLRRENERLRTALERIQSEARSNVKCRPIVHDIAQRALKGE